MLRTLLLLLIFGASFFVADAAMDFFNLDRAVGDLLEALFGSFADEDFIARFGLLGLGTVWLAYGCVMAVPGLRLRLLHTVVAWPFRQRPTASFFLRTGVFVLVAMAFMILVSATNSSGTTKIVLLFFLVAATCLVFVGMVLHDFHGILLSSAQLSVAPAEAGTTSTSGWILPEAITQEMLGKPELRFELAKDLRKRAANMRRFSFIALAGIAALLVVAVNVILFAGFIANLGVGVTGPERIQQLLDNERATLDGVQSSLRRLAQGDDGNKLKSFQANNKTRANIRSLSDQIPDELRAELEEIYAKSHTRRNYIKEKEKLEQLEVAHKNAIEAILIERTSYIQSNIKSDFGAAEQADNLNLLIASGITRFGILFIMLFIVQILVNLYRYTMRMSAYYLSQADALLLAEDSGDGLLKVMPVLSPQGVDFGKVPGTPVQSLEKLAEIAAKLR